MKNSISLLILLFPICVFAQVYDVLTFYKNASFDKGILIQTNINTDRETMSKIHIDGYDHGNKASLILDISINTKGGIKAANASSGGGLAPKVTLYDPGKVVIYLDYTFSYTRFHITAYGEGLEEDPNMYTGWSVSDADAPSDVPNFKVDYNNQFRDYVGVSGTLSADKIFTGNMVSQGRIVNYNSETDMNGNYTAYANNHFTQNAYQDLDGKWKAYGSKSNYGTAVLLQTEGLKGNAFNILIDSTFTSIYDSLNLKSLFTISTAGKTGIGSSNPKELLQVNGNITTVGNDKGYRFNSYFNSGNKLLSSGFGATMTLDSTGKFKYSNTNASGSADAAATLTDVFVIDKNGNVGVGTTNPQSRLAVNGDIFAKRVKVTITGWPDYVFEPNYKLPTLAEVERYININKHLPGVPSAVEVEKNGNDVGETQAALLHKIEELTLYVIELNKKIEKLEKQVK